MNTLLLDTVRWDLVLDTAGNIALATNPYAIAQDAASAIKTFAGECYYDTTLGVPYWEEILGQRPALSVVKAHVIAAALGVPETVAAVCRLESLTGRVLTGQVQITDTSGARQVVGF